MATYVNDLRLKEIATGDESGTWGTSTNTNLELIAEAFSFGTEAITTNADTHTTTIADGSTDPGRSLYLKYTGTLDSACTITIGPNTVSKLWLIENGTSGSQNIIISQGSGANVTIPAGHVKAIYSDGAGSSAAMVDAFTNLNLGGTTTVDDLTISDDLTVTDDLIVNGDIDLEGNMDINGSLETDALSLNGTTVSSTAAELNILDGVTSTTAELNILDGVTSTATELNLLDGSTANTVVNSKAVIYGSSGELAGTLSTAAQTNITSLGTLTTLTVDDITIDGSTISDSGDFTLDIGGDISLDAAGDQIRFKDNGTEVGHINMDSSNLTIRSTISDKDIIFTGNDDGVSVTALTLDMSASGAATFNAGATFGSHTRVNGDFSVSATSGEDRFAILPQSAGSGTIFFSGNEGLTGYEPLTIDFEDLRLRTSGTERMRITSGGAVGIGLTSPQGNLHVEGAAGASGGGIIYVTDADNGSTASDALHISKSGDTAFVYNRESSGDLQLGAGNTASHIVIKSDGKVGLGTTSPTTVLEVVNASAGDTVATFVGQFSSSGDVKLANFERYGSAVAAAIEYNDATTDMEFGTTTSHAFSLKTADTRRLTIDTSGNITQTGGDYIYSAGINFNIKHTGGGQNITFDTTPSGGSTTERMRVNTDGHVLIGTTTNQGVGGISFQHTSTGVNIQQNMDGTSGGAELYVFRRNSTQIGSINQSSTNAVTYNTSSDSRLKDVTGSSRGLDVINNLNPVAYNWKADNHADEGLIAQEVEELVPNAVNKDEDGYYSMDYSKLVTHLVKGMQEQQEQIESLKSEIASLKEK